MTEAEPSKHKRFNAAQHRALRAVQLKRFVKEYGRREDKGIDPNDRQYDREVEKSVKRMKPDELNRLSRDDE